MTMFLHKYRRTAAAMFRGWVVCNLVTFFAFALWMVIMALMQDGVNGRDVVNGVLFLLVFAMVAGAYSGVAILLAWLFVMLPVDLLVGDASWMRKPKPAAVCGAFGGFFGFAALWLALNFSAPDWAILPWIAAFGALAAITGMTASLHLVRNHPRQEQSCP